MAQLSTLGHVTGHDVSAYNFEDTDSRSEAPEATSETSALDFASLSAAHPSVC